MNDSDDDVITDANKLGADLLMHWLLLGLQLGVGMQLSTAKFPSYSGLNSNEQLPLRLISLQTVAGLCLLVFHSILPFSFLDMGNNSTA